MIFAAAQTYLSHLPAIADTKRQMVLATLAQLQ